MSRAILLLVVAALLAGPLAGCIKKGDDDGLVKSADQVKAEEILGETGKEAFVDAAAVLPKNYSFPEQALLPPVDLSFVGKVTSEALGALEIENDASGTHYRTVLQTYDLSPQIPVGQPAEIVVKLFWNAEELNSADLDIFVDVPGTRTSFSPTSESFNWNYAVKTVVVNTVGVAGLAPTVGVEIAGGAPTQGFDYQLDVSIRYVKDVLTPYHAWAIDVPEGASGIVLESEKAGGDEHLNATFVLIGPDDELIEAVVFDDISVPTESKFIPTRKPGQHVFYAQSMHGGFLRVKTDVPLEDTHARPLALVETTGVLSAEPAVGWAGKDYLAGSAGEGAMPKDDVGGAAYDFAVGPTFPLRVEATLAAQTTPMAKVTLASPAGVVHQLTRVLHYADERGTIGYTGEHEGGPNNVFTWTNLQKGAWSAQVVSNGAGIEVGYKVLTYQR